MTGRRSRKLTEWEVLARLGAPICIALVPERCGGSRAYVAEHDREANCWRVRLALGHLSQRRWEEIAPNFPWQRFKPRKGWHPFVVGDPIEVATQWR